MNNFKEPKSIENFLHNIEMLYNNDDTFIDDQLKESILLYKELEQQEKQINQVIVQKRSDFKEALRYIPLSVDSSLKIFIKTKIVQIEEKKKVIVDVLGKHVLNHQFNNSFIKEQDELEKLFGFETFPNLIKKMELVSTVDKFFEQPIQIDSKKMNEFKKRGELNNKQGLRLQGTIQDIFYCFNSDFILRIWLKKQVTNFKLPQNLQVFMNKKIASRREILVKVWQHIKANNLLKKGIVTLDKILSSIFTIPEDQNDVNYIAINEIGLQLKNFCTSEEKLEFNITMGENETSQHCYEMLYKIPLDETRECMAFFAEKMMFDEKSLQHAIKKNKNNFNLKYMKKEVLLKNKEEEIIKNFEKVKQYLIKRQNYNRFANNMEQFLVDFLEQQNQNLQSIRSHSANFIQKKNYGDPNDFMNHLINNYDDLIEREIKRIIKPSQYNQII